MSEQTNKIVYPAPASFAVYEAAPDARVVDNPDGRGVLVIVNLSQVADNSLTVIVEAYEPMSGAFCPLLISSPLTTSGMTALIVYPGVAEMPGIKADFHIGKKFRIRCVHANESNGITYSIGATLLV